MEDGDLEKLFGGLRFNQINLENHSDKPDFEDLLSNCYGRFGLIVDRHYRATPLDNVIVASHLNDITKLVGGILEKAPLDEQYILRNPFTNTERQFFYSDLISLFIAEKFEDSRPKD